MLSISQHLYEYWGNKFLFCGEKIISRVLAVNYGRKLQIPPVHIATVAYLCVLIICCTCVAWDTNSLIIFNVIISSCRILVENGLYTVGNCASISIYISVLIGSIYVCFSHVKDKVVVQFRRQEARQKRKI